MDRKFILTSLIYAIIGMALGIYMSATTDFTQSNTHRHIYMIGFVTTFFYGLCHKLWLNNNQGALAKVQFYAHQFGASLLLLSLYLMISGQVDSGVVIPLMAISYMVVLTGMVLMAILFLRSNSTGFQIH